MNPLQPISDEELLRITIQFYGKTFTEASEEKKKEILDAYRKAENETIEQIKAAGSVEAWYASGIGRQF